MTSNLIGSYSKIQWFFALFSPENALSHAHIDTMSGLLFVHLYDIIIEWLFYIIITVSWYSYRTAVLFGRVEIRDVVVETSFYYAAAVCLLIL